MQLRKDRQSLAEKRAKTLTLIKQLKASCPQARLELAPLVGDNFEDEETIRITTPNQCFVGPLHSTLQEAARQIG